MSKRISRKNIKEPVKIILDKVFIEGIVYYSNFIFTLSDGLVREYQTAFTLRNIDSRIENTIKRVKIEKEKLKSVEIVFIKKLSSYEP